MTLILLFYLYKKKTNRLLYLAVRLYWSIRKQFVLLCMYKMWRSDHATFSDCLLYSDWRNLSPQMKTRHIQHVQGCTVNRLLLIIIIDFLKPKIFFKYSINNGKINFYSLLLNSHLKLPNLIIRIEKTSFLICNNRWCRRIFSNRLILVDILTLDVISW